MVGVVDPDAVNVVEILFFQIIDESTKKCVAGYVLNQKMLTLKGDIFNDYNEENFKKLLKKNSEIISEIQVSDSGRKIFEFKRN